MGVPADDLREAIAFWRQRRRNVPLDADQLRLDWILAAAESTLPAPVDPPNNLELDARLRVIERALAMMPGPFLGATQPAQDQRKR
jgi:hypothetical protein